MNIFMSVTNKLQRWCNMKYLHNLTNFQSDKPKKNLISITNLLTLVYIKESCQRNMFAQPYELTSIPNITCRVCKVRTATETTSQILVKIECFRSRFWNDKAPAYFTKWDSITEIPQDSKLQTALLCSNNILPCWQNRVKIVTSFYYVTWNCPTLFEHGFHTWNSMTYSFLFFHAKYKSVIIFWFTCLNLKNGETYRRKTGQKQNTELKAYTCTVYHITIKRRSYIYRE